MAICICSLRRCCVLGLRLDVGGLLDVGMLDLVVGIACCYRVDAVLGLGLGSESPDCGVGWRIRTCGWCLARAVRW